MIRATRAGTAIRALATVALAGLLSSGSCHAHACFGDCEEHPPPRDPPPLGAREHFRSFELSVQGVAPAPVARVFSAVRGPWLSPAERADPEGREAFARDVLTANAELLGLGELLRLEVEARNERTALVLVCHARDLLGSSEVALRVEASGRLSGAVALRTWR